MPHTTRRIVQGIKLIYLRKTSGPLPQAQLQILQLIMLPIPITGTRNPTTPLTQSPPSLPSASTTQE